MSIACPKCGTEILQDFGLVACHSCSAVISIDVEGMAHLASETIHQAEGYEPENQLVVEAIIEQEPAVEAFAINAVEPEVSVDPVADPFQFDSFADHSESQTLQSAFKEITEFGNKETSAGPITYTVFIENIEVPELAQKVNQVLSEPKMNLDIKDFAKKIQKGQIILENLNPVQAVMVIKKLRGVNVKLSWSQNLYS